MVQWLRLWPPNARGLCSIPGLGTRSHMLQLKILHVATKTHINIKKKSKEGIMVILETKTHLKLY